MKRLGVRAHRGGFRRDTAKMRAERVEKAGCPYHSVKRFVDTDVTARGISTLLLQGVATQT